MFIKLSNLTLLQFCFKPDHFLLVVKSGASLLWSPGISLIGLSDRIIYSLQMAGILEDILPYWFYLTPLLK